jgi:hypothetical protein
MTGGHHRKLAIMEYVALIIGASVGLIYLPVAQAID